MVTKAFIVGINDYSPAGPSRLDLNGCVSDARDMANTLVICGFDPKSASAPTGPRPKPAFSRAWTGSLKAPRKATRWCSIIRATARR